MGITLIRIYILIELLKLFSDKLWKYLKAELQTNWFATFSEYRRLNAEYYQNLVECGWFFVTSASVSQVTNFLIPLNLFTSKQQTTVPPDFLASPVIFYTVHDGPSHTGPKSFITTYRYVLFGRNVTYRNDDRVRKCCSRSLSKPFYGVNRLQRKRTDRFVHNRHNVTFAYVIKRIISASFSPCTRKHGVTCVMCDCSRCRLLKATYFVFKLTVDDNNWCVDGYTFALYNTVHTHTHIYNAMYDMFHVRPVTADSGTETLEPANA